ncbi:MAG: aa3-type cytochrome c oxidase subunit IV [Rhodoblastus sp.]
MAHEPGNAIQPYGHPDMDYVEHEKTYDLFVNLFKWGTVFCVGCVVLLGVLTL